MSDEQQRVRDVRGTVITEVHRTLSDLGSAVADRVPQVLVRTRSSLPGAAQAEIRAGVREVRSMFGDGGVRVEFDTAPDADEPCDVTVLPLGRAGAAPGPVDEPPGPPVGGEPRLLVLGFDGIEFHFLLEPGREWVPLLRPRAGHDGHGLLLPESLSDVPHGHLVDLFCADGVLRARRGPERLDYAVSVDGLPLDRDGVELAERGEILFSSRTGATRRALAYELVEWTDEAPTAGSGADVLDGGPHRAESSDPSNPGALLVLPPEPGTKAATRRFPLPTGRADVRVRDVHVQVLYTTATHVGTDERSHVKIYRCATPQHTEYLRRHLATQAGLVRQANAVAGRTGERTWAVAPIQLVATPAPPEVLTTRVAPAAVVRGAAEHRLSAWFGVPDQPQPDCFVIVASPLLEPVGWARHEQLGKAPSEGQLSALAHLAAGVDHLHLLGVAHCDIRPQNVCHHLDAQGRTRYVLVDGDAVTRSVGPVAELRFTPEYASAEVIRAARRVRAPGRDVIDVREHDRFGFVLVALTALIGIDKVDALLRGGADGRRPVDSVAVVAEVLGEAWTPGWSRFVAALVDPFRPGALADDGWSAKAWLERLVALWSPEENARGGIRDRVAAGRHGREVTALRADMPALAWPEWRGELVDRVRAAQLGIARREYRARLWKGRLVFLLALLVLITAVMGGVK